MLPLVLLSCMAAAGCRCLAMPWHGISCCTSCMVCRAEKHWHTRSSPCWSYGAAWWLRHSAWAFAHSDRILLTSRAVPFAFLQLWTKFRERGWGQAPGLSNVYKAQEHTKAPHLQFWDELGHELQLGRTEAGPDLSTQNRKHVVCQSQGAVSVQEVGQHARQCSASVQHLLRDAGQVWRAHHLALR